MAVGCFYHAPLAMAATPLSPAEQAQAALDRLSQQRLRQPTAPQTNVADLIKQLPAALQSPTVRKALTLPGLPDLPTSLPITGPVNAPILVLELTDLGCLDCRALSRQLDSLIAKYPHLVRRAFLPLTGQSEGHSAGFNTAAFLGKMAQNQGKFWEFRHAALNLNQVGVKQLTQAIISTGISQAKLRQGYFLAANSILPVLAAEQQYATRIHGTRAPTIFINGMRLEVDLPLASAEALLQLLSTTQGQTLLNNYLKLAKAAL